MKTEKLTSMTTDVRGGAFSQSDSYSGETSEAYYRRYFMIFKEEFPPD